MKKLRTLFLIVVLLGSKFSIAGDGKNWTAGAEPTRSFIENKGQFKLADEKTAINSTVKFAFDGGSTMIYFTPTGISYSFLKRWKENENKDAREVAREKAREQQEMHNGKSHLEMEAEEHRMEFKTDVVNMIWEGANVNVQLIAEQPTTDYHSYMLQGSDGQDENINNIKAYKKLIYKNLYPNIDVEYTFHPQEGIKYTLILHPGADVSKVKMNYSDAVQLTSKGEIHIQTAFGDIIDHAPLSFYSGNSSSVIESKFIKTGKTVSFELGIYDRSKSLTIDPWTVTPTGLNNTNCVWECEKDALGNVYIIGGDVPLKLKKYNSGGVLQWTYNTPFDTTNGDWLGTMATDLAGNSYVTNGANARLLKVNNAAGMVYLVNGGAVDEYWNIAFNCDQTKLIVGGTRIAGLFPPANCYGMIFDINTATGAVLATQKVGYTRTYSITIPFIGTTSVSDINEVRSITSSRNARYYYLTLDSVGCIDQNFSICPNTTTIFSINSTYDLGYKAENFRPDNGNSGICAIRANGNFVYSQNGTTIHKRSLATGAILASATLAGGSSATISGTTPTIYQPQNSGIDIDSCGNVYVGSGNAVIKYDANLNLLSSAATTFSVYDVTVSYGGNVIVAGSTGTSASTSRTGFVQQINMSACNPMTLVCCNSNFCPAGPFCSTDAPVTLTPEQAGGTWSGPGVNSSTGVFSPSVAGPGTHVITYTLACGSSSVSIVVSPCTAPAITACQSGGNITASSPSSTYTWYNSTTVTPCVPGIGFCSGFGTVAGTPVVTWTSFATGATINPGTNFPIWVVNGNGDSLQITSLASLAVCSSCPPLTVTPAAQVNVSCFGGSTGSFSASTTGGSSPYDYTLMNGATTVATFNNVAGSQAFLGLAAGTYTLNVLDNSACPGSVTITITQPATALSVAITGTTTASCGSANGTATAQASGGTSPYDYVWTDGTGTLQTTNNITTSNTLSGLAAGTYTITITDNNNCTATTTATITSSGSASVSITGQNNVLCFGGTTGDATATASGGVSPYDYVWSNGTGTLQTTLNVAGSNTLSGLAAGTYTVNITDNGGCTSSSTVTITQPATAASVAITASTNTACGATTGSATAQASGGTSPYDYVWANGTGTLQTVTNITTDNTLSGLAAGTYSVTIADANNCTSTTTVTITSTGGATTSITAQTDVLCFGGTTGDATGTASGGVGPYDYVWSNASGTLQTANNVVGSNTLSGLAAGTYSVTVTDNSGCVSNATVTITEPASAAAVVVTGTTGAACGSATGSATAQASGGTSPYDYVWSDGTGTLQTTTNITTANTLSGIAAGTYSVTITDANGCVSTATAIVSNAGAGLTNITGFNNVSCFGGTNGDATANTVGGTGPYDYVWTGSAGTLQTTNNISVPNTLSGLGAGTYTITVTDNAGCLSLATVTITQPATVLSVGTTAATNTTCGFNNGTTTVAATGGTSGYTYTWAPGGASGASVSGLAAGTYTVTVTDANGCTATNTNTIAASTGITASITSPVNVLCNGASTGSATAVGSGGTTYTYSWTGGAGTAAIATGLASGSYTVTVTSGTCSNTASVTITQPPAILASVNTTPTICLSNNGTATVTASGGNGVLTSLWNTTATTSTITNLNAGTYSVTITDVNGCTQTASGVVGVAGGITASVSPDVIITLGDSTTLTASGGLTYTWTPATGLSCNTCANPVANPTVTTTYCVLADSATCTDQACVTVTVEMPCPDNKDLAVPNAFSPNEDGHNDILCLQGWSNCIQNFTIFIYDRWGEKVFESADAGFCWDGKYKGKLMDPAVFVYFIEATFSNGTKIDAKGNISLIR